MHHFLAIDLGAESGRGIIVTLKDSRVSIEEIHRFANRRITLGGTMYWDFPYLFAEVLRTMRLCSEKNVKLEGISVDTWGVDFGLLGRDGKLLGNPVCYRDGRTDGIFEYSDPIISRDEIYSLTGYEPWAISSLFQLLAMKRDNSPLLDVAETFLNMPDLFHYFLTGRKVSEKSIANTSNLMTVEGKWCNEIIDKFDLPNMFAELIEPATVVGELCEAVQRETELGNVPVIATCGHDTSGTLTAVPAKGDNWAFISCGTWSIPGILLDKPLNEQRCHEMGFSNQYTLDGWYMVQNVSGLWLVQEMRRKWDRPQDPWDYNRTTAEASRHESGPLIDVSDESLMAPNDMEQAIETLLEKTGQEKTPSRGQLIRCALESLALQYNTAIDSMECLVGKRPEKVYVVGGGIRNKLLCQFTANACGLEIHAGADQCTAMGNGLGQALAVGVLKSGEDIRRIMRDSTESTLYRPQAQGVWEEKRRRYHDLQKR